MLYLLWGLLNLFLFVYFIAICFKATKLLREKLGMLATIVFVFGLLSFTTISSNNKSTKLKTWKFVSADSVNADSYLSARLHNNLISKYELGISYKNDGQTNIPVSATSTTDGVICGTKWKPLFINVQSTANNTFQYTVSGIVEWKLLGFTVYSQQKFYKGFVSANGY
jgi:hypothetical protein